VWRGIVADKVAEFRVLLTEAVVAGELRHGRYAVPPRLILLGLRICSATKLHGFEMLGALLGYLRLRCIGGRSRCHLVEPSYERSVNCTIQNRGETCSPTRV
jgi:hypothetical protein